MNETPVSLGQLVTIDKKEWPFAIGSLTRVYHHQSPDGTSEWWGVVTYNESVFAHAPLSLIHPYEQEDDNAQT